MFDGPGNDAALRVYESAFILYLLAGGALMLILTKGFKQSGENPIWKKLISLPFLPAFVVCVIILSIFSVPFWWLYPEKHMTRIDFEGNDEEKAKLREYREILRKKSIWRRFAERLGLAPKAAPPWPFSTKH